MPIRLLLILASALGACATAPDDVPPVCDGRDRRPANPHGSILLPSPTIATDAETPPEHPSSTGGCA